MSATNRNGLARHEHDFYETPAEAIDVVLDVLGITDAYDGYVIDPGTGTGAIAARIAARAPKADVRGIDKAPELLALAREKRGESVGWELADWLEWQPDGTPDLIIGNPPFQHVVFDPNAIPTKRWEKTSELQRDSGNYRLEKRDDCWAVFCSGAPIGGGKTLKEAKQVACVHDPARGAQVIVDSDLAEKFVRKALAVAGKKGTVAMLLRTGFMIPKTRRVLREEFGLPDKYELETRPSFNGSGTDATDYAWFVWSPKQKARWIVCKKGGAK